MLRRLSDDWIAAEPGHRRPRGGAARRAGAPRGPGPQARRPRSVGSAPDDVRARTPGPPPEGSDHVHSTARGRAAAHPRRRPAQHPRIPRPGGPARCARPGGVAAAQRGGRRPGAVEPRPAAVALDRAPSADADPRRLPPGQRALAPQPDLRHRRLDGPGRRPSRRRRVLPVPRRLPRPRVGGRRRGAGCLRVGDGRAGAGPSVLGAALRHPSRGHRRRLVRLVDRLRRARPHPAARRGATRLRSSTARSRRSEPVGSGRQRRSQRPPLLGGERRGVVSQYLDADVVGTCVAVRLHTGCDRFLVTPHDQGIDEAIAAAVGKVIVGEPWRFQLFE